MKDEYWIEHVKKLAEKMYSFGPSDEIILSPFERGFICGVLDRAAKCEKCSDA